MASVTAGSPRLRAVRAGAGAPTDGDDDGGALDGRHARQVDVHLVDSLVASIQERISNGQFPFGTWLRQERLAQELGVSRMPIREALRQLQAMGAVEIIAHRGARVRLPSTRDIVEVYELRGVLEGHAAALAARLITSEQIERLQHADQLFRKLVDDLRDAPRSAAVNVRPQWHEANSEFHSVIIEASGSKHLAEMIDNLHRKIPRNLSWLALGNDPRRLMQNAAEHSQILEAIDKGESETARSLVLHHAQRASELMVRTLNELDPASSTIVPTSSARKESR